MSAEQKGNGRRLKRWAIFGIMIGVTLATLFAMISTSDTGRVFGVRLPGSGTAEKRYLLMCSNFGHIEFEIESTTMLPPSPGPYPLFFLESYRDPFIVERGISFVWILAVECLVLSFLVPSFLSGRKAVHR
jgi:hypothetical protein